MPEYHLTWEIDLDADSPRQAAEKALTIHRNPESIATVFDVKDETGHTERIDLDDAEDEEACIQAPTGKTYCRACFDQGQG